MEARNGRHEESDFRTREAQRGKGSPTELSFSEAEMEYFLFMQTSGDAQHVSAFMLNNLRDLYHKHEESGDAASLEEDEMTINLTGFSFFIGMLRVSEPKS